MTDKNTVFHANRISGQVKGISKMIVEKKDAHLIVAQIMAARASLDKLAVKIIKEESLKCPKARIDKLVDILFRIK